MEKSAEIVKSNSWRDFLLSPTDEFTDPEPIIQQGDRVLLSRGNIATITGKPKAFKTFLNTGICAGVLENETLTFSSSINSAKVLFIDTEQAKSHAQKVQHRIFNLCGYDTKEKNIRLNYSTLREIDAKNRLDISIQTIENLKPDLVIIDGIRDLVLDFNDLTESGQVVGEMMRLTSKYNCGILVVLHQNKADNNARGHLGSELCNKCETVIQVVNTAGIATVSPVYSRNREIENFSFRIDDAGLPVLCDEPKMEKKTGEIAELMRKSMFGSAWMSRKDLTAKVEIVSGKTSRTAERKVKEALEGGVIKYNQSRQIILSQVENNNDNDSKFLF
jgi:hypothetical protein